MLKYYMFWSRHVRDLIWQGWIQKITQNRSGILSSKAGLNILLKTGPGSHLARPGLLVLWFASLVVC